MQMLKEVELTTCFNPLVVGRARKWGAKITPRWLGICVRFAPFPESEDTRGGGFQT